MELSREQIEQFKLKLRSILEDEKSRTYLLIGVTAVIAAFYFSFGIIPKATEMAKTARKVSSYNDKIDLVTSRVNRLDAINRKLVALREEYKGYSKSLPAQKEVPEFLEGLADIARTSKVKIQSITPTKTPDGETPSDKYYVEMPVRITARSGYHELGHFISNLEKGERLVIIKDLSIRSDPGDPWMHNIRILLNAYVSVQ